MGIDPKDAGRDREDAEGDISPDAQTLSGVDQGESDRDQTGSDLDQTTADGDQSASERDQLASDRDQEAADSDQAMIDRAGHGDFAADYARSRRARSRSSLDRDEASHARSDNAHIRDETAGRRDRAAEERDQVAQARDRLAERLDGDLDRLEVEQKENLGLTGSEVLARTAAHRKRAAEGRARAAAQRGAAALDREEAALDRKQAALDRSAAAEELAMEGFDYVTGALRRRVGLAAIQRELERTARSEEPMAVAFIKVDGLKAVNEELGDEVGDDLLRETVSAIKDSLRSYDVITRLAGDEFVCSLSGEDAARATKRFDQIALNLAGGKTNASFAVGIAHRRKPEPLDDLIRRADEAMRQTTGRGPASRAEPT